jgi:hypothetical protein
MWSRTEHREIEIEPGGSSYPAQRALDNYFADHPAIAEINYLAGELAEILGPMFWAALIVLFIWAEMSG